MEGNRKRHRWLNETLMKIEEEFNSTPPFNRIEGEGRIGIIVEGPPLQLREGDPAQDQR